MLKKIKLNDETYNTTDFTNGGKEICHRLAFIESKFRELSSKRAILSRSKNAYINDLKEEILKDKLGVDLEGLFFDDN